MLLTREHQSNLSNYIASLPSKGGEIFHGTSTKVRESAHSMKAEWNSFWKTHRRIFGAVTIAITLAATSGLTSACTCTGDSCDTTDTSNPNKPQVQTQEQCMTFDYSVTGPYVGPNGNDSHLTGGGPPYHEISHELLDSTPGKENTYAVKMCRTIGAQ